MKTVVKTLSTAIKLLEVSENENRKTEDTNMNKNATSD